MHCLRLPGVFYDVSFKGEAFKFQRDYGSYVMENVH